MKPRFLFPHRWKKWGWIIILLSIVLLILNSLIDMTWLNVPVFQQQLFGDNRWDWSPVNLSVTIIGIGLIAGLSFVAFSKLKTEDEFTIQIRMESLQWAVYVNYGLLLLAFIFIYGLSFFNVMEYNMFTILIIFIIRFHWILYRQKRLLKNEK